MSYAAKPWAKHYTEKHPQEEPELSLEIMSKGTSLINRKIKEARFINKIKPQVNDKTELNQLQQFLVE